VNRGGSRGYALLAALAVLVLVGLVAVASSGSVTTGTNDSRPPGRVLIDTIASLGLVLLLPAIALAVYGFMQRKEIAREMSSGKYPRTGIGTVLAAALFAALIAWARLHGWGPFGQSSDTGLPGVPRVGAPGDAGDVQQPQAQFEWIPVLVVLGLVALAGAGYAVARRRRRSALTLDVAAASEEIAALLDESLDDLRAEPDPRRAVIAAYARLERALAASGLPRRRSETAVEYVARITDGLQVERAPVRRLTELFTYAKFSQHEVDEAQKDEAIAALTKVRDELRAAASRAEEPAPASELERAGTAPS
jgi:hypothetical protein